MNVRERNACLAKAEIDHPGLWPYLTEMKAKAVSFRLDFGLETLPLEPGLLIIRGPRQYGKSTWLEQKLYESVQIFGPGSSFYLNGDELNSVEDFVSNLRMAHTAYSPHVKFKRLFIDEVTAIPFWEKGIKRVLDEGLFRDVLIVTTGSKAADLRHGSEKLPGRKGHLARNEYLFLPVSYQEFHKQCHSKLGSKTWKAYLLTGGSPIGCHDIFLQGRLPEYFIQLTRDWILGDLVASGRSRISLANIFQCLFRWAGQATGYARLSREAGLANNTVASGYIERLTDLLCLIPSWPWDPSRDILQPRKPCKFQFINLAAVMAFNPRMLRSVEEFDSLSEPEQGILLEWLVAQEIWRRSVLKKVENPESIGFWKSQEHEIDFVTPERTLIEVKRGSVSVLEFSWFSKIFPNKSLTVINRNSFETRQVRGITMEEFLLSDSNA